MMQLLNVPIFILLGVILIKQKITCYLSENDNIKQLKYMIDNDDLYNNLLTAEKLIIEFFKHDELQLPILKPGVSEYLNMSNFTLIKHNANTENEISKVIPSVRADAQDLIKYEHITKQQLVQTYNSEKADLYKKRSLLLRSLKIVIFLLIPMNSYRETKDLKKSLMILNDIFMEKDEKQEQENSQLYSKSYFQSILNYINNIKEINPKKNVYSYLIIGDDLLKIQNSNDLFFTTNDNIDFMNKLDNLSAHFGISMYNLVGSHLIALGHLFILKLALSKYDKFFIHGKFKFFSWEKLLSFNISDRFRALDSMCNVEGIYDVEEKRRINYLKDKRKSEFDVCNILEFLVHYFNKYQMSLLTNAYQEDFKPLLFLEHTHIKSEFFKFICSDITNCNIYKSRQFAVEDEDLTILNSSESDNDSLNPFSIYTNFVYFSRCYNKFTPKQILYMHFLNLTGLLNNESMAYVSSLYLPGYFNAIELSFDEESNISDLIDNLLQCVEKCNSSENKYIASEEKDNTKLEYELSKSTKCNICLGAFTYINSKHEDTSSMLQKFYIYTTKIINISNISTLIRNMNIYEEYDNFLTNDINWYTFLLLLRLASYKDIANKNIGEAMYLNLKKEDNFNKTITTNYWFPSPLKKAYTLYIRSNLAVNLVEKLEKMLSSDAIEKMKKSIRFMVHVNSFLQLDFFHNLNEPPTGEQRLYPLSMLIENKFLYWFYNSSLGFFFLCYDDPSIRRRMHEKVLSQRFEAPKYSNWVLHMKKYIEKAYESYFNQRHVKNLYKDYNVFNINNKIMLMKDSYEMYEKNYKDLIFFADIFNLRKYLTATPRAIKLTNKFYYYMHSIAGNTLNFYKYGMIYGFTINKTYLKEFSNELFSIYKMNKNIFSDISFLQSVYLLFRKIESSFHVHRRNDKISLNNLFFLNVSNNYSKMSKEKRLEELHNSMASRFFSKTLFSTFQMMFSTKLSNYADELDRTYGKEEMLGLTVNEKAFFKFAYVYYGSIMDNITNSLLPPYAKKPITQLKYGKTFIFSNYFILCSQVFSLLNLNNLSLLCESQAVASSTYYSSMKMDQFVDKKFVPLVVGFAILRFNDVMDNPSEYSNIRNNLIDKAKPNHPLLFLGIHMATNLFFDSARFFPVSLTHKLNEQTSHVTITNPNLKPLTFSFSKILILQLINGLSCVMFLFPLLRYYAFYQNFSFFFIKPIRFMNRFHNVFERYVNNIIKTNFRKYTTDELIKFTEKTLLNIKKRGLMKESLKARIEAKKVKYHPVIKNLDGNIPTLTPQEYDRLTKADYSFYVDDNSFFDGIDKKEKFLNDKDYLRSNDLEDVSSTSSKSNKPQKQENEKSNKEVKYKKEEMKETKKQHQEMIGNDIYIKEQHRDDDENELYDNEGVFDEVLMVTRTPNQLK
ncbi:cytoadherence linked asexual protein [Plasmodium brasilianum]|uniref:Cytoadherence linked asexual protein, putative n=2 Tax=Plasmodium (Plasmodium) TaxID=418103 RepID=A0A1D3PA23_PLAMA|nr:cytoadherence linked asexual protein, putative [Plasmodium malariae]KAI4838715.1 cytoadherence linked asexual protein [Plasmodium brasilianum]SCN12047.1 cytoadherence linked asexual protein, putative [Plasmodium malariae]